MDHKFLEDFFRLTDGYSLAVIFLFVKENRERNFYEES